MQLVFMPYKAEKSKPTVNPSDYYDRETIEAFGREIEQLYQRTVKQLGKEDVEKMKALVETSKLFERLGRSLIHFSAGPVTWLSGVLLLSGHYVMEFTNGHNVLHGHYDDIDDSGELNSFTYEWDNTVDETDWKFEHHTSHHPFTNVLGKDADYGYLLLRANDDQPWHFRYLAQLGIFASIPLSVDLLMPWYIATSRALVEGKEAVTVTQGLDYLASPGDLLEPGTIGSIFDTYRAGIFRILKRKVKNYLFYPLLSGPSFLKVAGGNLLADMISNTHMILMLAMEHHNENIPLIEPAVNETKADFYLRQVISTQNYELPGWYEDLFTGGVNIHIEHHLFPDLPFNRLKEISPEVEAICKKYNVPYRRENVFSSLAGLTSLIVEKMFPTQSTDPGIFELLKNPLELGQRLLDGFTKSFEPKAKRVTNSTFVKARVQSVKNETAFAKRINITVPGNYLNNTPRGGQYISISVRIGGRDHVRQYSIIEPGQISELSIIVKRVEGGLVSNYIHDNIKAGDQVTLVGPVKGEFCFHLSQRPVVFIAAGVGITPIYSMLKEMGGNDELKNVTLFYYNHDEDSIILKSEIKELEEKYNLKVNHRLSTEGQKFTSQFVVDEIESESQVYACAPLQFLKSLETSLVNHNFPMQHYYYEKFSSEKAEVHLTGKTHNLKLLSSQKTVSIDEGMPLLEALERSGCIIASGCRRGLCKACIVKVESGRILTADKKEEKKVSGNNITSCNSYARSDLQIWI